MQNESQYNGSMFRNPNVHNHYLKEWCRNENEHKYKSTIKGVYLGMLNNIPVTDDFANKAKNEETEDPIAIAHALKRREQYRKERFPGRNIFGHKSSTRDKVVLPIDSREFHNLDLKLGNKSMNRYRKSIKTYDKANTMSWMDSSIDISQPQVKRYNFTEDNGDEVVTKIYMPQSDDISQAQKSGIDWKDSAVSNYDYLGTLRQQKKVVDNKKFRVMPPSKDIRYNMPVPKNVLRMRSLDNSPLRHVAKSIELDRMDQGNLNLQNLKQQSGRNDMTMIQKTNRL